MKKGFKSAFTMIELIFVIIILGILAATALPKFIGIQDDAKISTEKGTIGAVRGGIALSHGKWLLRQGTSNDWDGDGKDETFTTQGYLANLETGEGKDDGSATTNIFGEILTEGAQDWERLATSDANATNYAGPATTNDTGVPDEGTNDINKSGAWQYSNTKGTVTYIEN